MENLSNQVIVYILLSIIGLIIILVPSDLFNKKISKNLKCSTHRFILVTIIWSFLIIFTTLIIIYIFNIK